MLFKRYLVSHQSAPVQRTTPCPCGEVERQTPACRGSISLIFQITMEPSIIDFSNTRTDVNPQACYDHEETQESERTGTGDPVPAHPCRGQDGKRVRQGAEAV